MNTFVFNFTDPATIYCHLLILFHHEVMWYLIFILCIVNWSLYSVVRTFAWSSLSFFSPNFYKFKLFLFLSLKHLISLFFYYGIFYGFFEEVDVPLSFNRIPKFSTQRTTFNTLYLFSAYNKDILYFRPETRESIINYCYMLKKEIRVWPKVVYFSHSTMSEFTWASLPTAIVALILLPSLLLLFCLDEDLSPVLSYKVLGHQWFWSYEHSYPHFALESSFPSFNSIANGIQTFSFDSIMVPEAELPLGSKRLLTVDNPLMVPVNVPIRYLITSSDVLHSWAVPSLGVKVDAVPGRLSQSILIIRRLGVFYGQCSELCGVAHGFMPIVIGTHRIGAYDSIITPVNSVAMSD